MRFHRTCLATYSCWYTSECLIGVAYPICSKQMRQEKKPERLEQAQKNTTGGNRRCFLICLFHRTFKQVYCTIKKSLCQKYCYCIVFILSSSASSLTLGQLLIQ